MPPRKGENGGQLISGQLLMPTSLNGHDDIKKRPFNNIKCPVCVLSILKRLRDIFISG